MSLDFKSLGQIPAASTIYHLSSDLDGALWAATPLGLFRGAVDGWSPAAGNFPFTQVGAVLSLGKVVLAAGLSGGLVCSQHAGENWLRCSLEQVTQPITCLAASPNYAFDQVVLAGTAGDGVLRSVNGGRSWQLVNFGLRDFSIYCLSSAKVWKQKEPVFAGSANGVYYSPNGGRAWRFVGLDGYVILSLAIHPDFQRSPVILAGTESHGLWCSTDGGRDWNQLDLHADEMLTVNALLITPNTWLVATSEAGIFNSQDEGRSWRPAQTSLPPVLSLAECAGYLYAATYQEGIYRSQDGGESWDKIDNWVAQRFNQLLVWHGERNHHWLAMGPKSGMWISEAEADTWLPVSNLDPSSSWFCMATCQGKLILAGEDGVWCIPSPGEQAEHLLRSDQGVISLAALDQQILAGTISGELWHSADCGRSWHSVALPFNGLPVVALCLHQQITGVMLAVAVINQRQEQIEMWRLFSSNRGEPTSEWELWLTEKSIYQSVVMLLDGEGGENSWIGLGNALLFRQTGGWRRKQLTMKNTPVTALTKSPQPNCWLAAAGLSVFTGERQGDWEKVAGFSKAFVDFEWDENQNGELILIGLTASGELIAITE